jgi:hypothetical protein
MHTQISLANLDARRRHAMLDLAASCCPRIDASAYLPARLAHYDYAIVSEAAGELLAFELVQEFEERGERHVYLGPLFSRRVACVPMFVDFIASIVATTRRPFHFVAEVQNPHVALVLKQLFFRSSFPRLESGEVPARVRRIAARFRARLPHIGPLDPRSLSARGSETLFRPTPAYAPVIDWMERRNVDLAAGDSQLFVVSCDGSISAREALARELRLGADALADWPACKRTMLRRFDRAVSHVGGSPT